MSSDPSHDPLANKSQAWSALFTEPMSELVQRYTASVGFDQRLWRADIEGSLAHAEMLAAQGIIGEQDLVDIRRGMAQIVAGLEAMGLKHIPSYGNFVAFHIDNAAAVYRRLLELGVIVRPDRKSTRLNSSH